MQILDFASLHRRLYLLPTIPCQSASLAVPVSYHTLSLFVDDESGMLTPG